MKLRLSSTFLAAMLAVAVAIPASAGPPQTRVGASGMRSVDLSSSSARSVPRAKASTRSRSVRSIPDRPSSRPDIARRGSRPDLSRSNGLSRGSGRSDSGLLDGVRRDYPNGGMGGLLERAARGGYGSGLGDYGRYGGYGDRYDREDELADAVRDAAIANAVVDVVGIIAGAAMHQQDRAVAVAPPPPAPTGYYETRRVQIREGHYERATVHVPEQVDPQTGDVIEAHQEVRRRWVPPVYEERQVWVVR